MSKVSDFLLISNFSKFLIPLVARRESVNIKLLLSCGRVMNEKSLSITKV